MRIRGSSYPSLSFTPSAINAAASTPSPSNSPSSIDSFSRCEGLDLLVLAVIEVSGYRALEMDKSATIEVGGEGEDKHGIGKRKRELGGEAEVGLNPKRKRRQLAMPSRYQDSVMQPWKRRTRRRRIAANRSG